MGSHAVARARLSAAARPVRRQLTDGCSVVQVRVVACFGVQVLDIIGRIVATRATTQVRRREGMLFSILALRCVEAQRYSVACSGASAPTRGAARGGPRVAVSLGG